MDRKIISEICEIDKLKIEFCDSRKNAYHYINEISNEVLFIASKRGPHYAKRTYDQLKYGKNPHLRKIQFNVYSGVDQVDSVYYDEVTHRVLVLFKSHGCLELSAQRLPHEKLFSIARHFENRRIF